MRQRLTNVTRIDTVQNKLQPEFDLLKLYGQRLSQADRNKMHRWLLERKYIVIRRQKLFASAQFPKDALAT